MSARVSDLLGGLAPSATLAVDAKAKALKAAGKLVIVPRLAWLKHGAGGAVAIVEELAAIVAAEREAR